MKIKPAGAKRQQSVIEDATGNAEEISGFEKEDGPLSDGIKAASTLPHPQPKAGDLLTVETDQGNIGLRITTVLPDGAVTGTIELLDAPNGMRFDIDGSRHENPVVVPGAEYVYNIEPG